MRFRSPPEAPPNPARPPTHPALSTLAPPTTVDLQSALKVALSKYSPTTPGATLFGKIKLKVQEPVYMCSCRVITFRRCHPRLFALLACSQTSVVGERVIPSPSVVGIFKVSVTGSDDVIFLTFFGQPRLSTFFEVRFFHPALFDNMPVAFRNRSLLRAPLLLVRQYQPVGRITKGVGACAILGST